MTEIITDPEVLQEYKDDANYYEDQHPKEQSRIAKFLGKASESIEHTVSKVHAAATGPTAKKADGFLRDLAARQNAHDGLGGDDGGFDIRNISNDDRRQHEDNGMQRRSKRKHQQRERRQTDEEYDPLSRNPLMRRGGDHL